MLKITKKFTVLLTLITLITSVTNYSYASSSRLGVVSVWMGYLNLRSGPGIHYRVKSKMPKNTIIRVHSTSGTWYKVSYGRTVGYADKRYIKLYSNTRAVRATSEALSFMGVRYVWGGTSPRGFDCSGVVQYVYKRQGINLPRVAHAQSRTGKWVSKKNLIVGDLVFFSSSRSYNNVTHVGIYIGQGKFVHASSGAKCVTVSYLSKLYYLRTYVGARRVY